MKWGGRLGVGVKGIDHFSLDLTENFNGRHVIDVSFQSKALKGLGGKLKVETDGFLGIENLEEAAVMAGPFEKSFLKANSNKFKFGWVWGMFSQDLIDVDLDLLLPYLFELSMMSDAELLTELANRLAEEEKKRKEAAELEELQRLMR